jgi:hypothetical protein
MNMIVPILFLILDPGSAASQEPPPAFGSDRNGPFPCRRRKEMRILIAARLPLGAPRRTEYNER